MIFKRNQIFGDIYPLALFHIRHISLVQFRNYKQSAFGFEGRITGICGQNGVGKTNLLDALYYLCFTKSYFTRQDNKLAYHGLQGFRLSAAVELGGQNLELTAILRETGKKEFLVDGEAYPRLSMHIGRFPAVMIAPDDIEIITGASEERRRYLDTLLCQLDPEYLQNLARYTRVLLQRNGFLRSARENNQAPDPALLDVYDQQLIHCGDQVYNKRKAFIPGFIGQIQSFYELIAGRPEAVSLEYESQLQQGGMARLLKNSRQRDLAAGRTTAGIHRDDLLIKLGDMEFRGIASQGQRKSLLFGLKLASFNSLKTALGISPVLLLDDVFEKLDSQRMDNLLHWVCREMEAQVFITDTHEDRLNHTLKATGEQFGVVRISQL